MKANPLGVTHADYAKERPAPAGPVCVRTHVFNYVVRDLLGRRAVARR